MTTISGPTILLFSGNYFNFLDPSGSIFTIEDIAQGLAFTARFSGQTAKGRWYSVAEHSVVASWHVAPENALAALMHDATETFIRDVPAPLKRKLPDYLRYEQKIEAAVLARFGIALPLPDEVKNIDMRLLATEQQQVMENFDDWEVLRGVDPLPIRLGFWERGEAMTNFLRRFEELSRGMAQAA